MAIRIYALAKELQLDNKELVDLLPKAGITGKGSALASLGDDEVAKIKEFLSKKTARPADRAAAPIGERPERSTTGAPVREIKNLDRPRPLPPAKTNRSAPAETTAPPHDEPAPATEPEVLDAPTPDVAEPTESAPPSVAATGDSNPVAPTTTAPAPERPPTPERPAPGAMHRSSPLGSRVNRSSSMAPPDTGPLRREDYIAPAGVQRKPVDLSARRDDSANTQRRKPGEQQSRPIVRLAPMNLAPVPTLKPTKSNEPAPQKPDMKLPMDVIRQSKTGSAKPLQEHMKTVVQKQADIAKAKARGPMLPETPTPGRGKKGGKPGEGELGSKLGGREARQLIRKGKGGNAPGRIGGSDESPSYRRPYRPKIKRTKSGSTAAPRKSKVVLDLPCTVREFSEAAGISAAQLLARLMALGIMKTITGILDQETAEMLALEFGVELDLREGFDVEEELLKDAEMPDDEASLQPRPPVVTFLGHVDHGKTSLLDKIIGIKVAAGESGGITQHIRAYEIEKEGRKISFVDTPGHEAFTEMRARGANVTDIAVLVVAADDGVMPQTEEAISHARAAGVPIVVALNKSDLPGWDEQKIFQQLATADLLPTAWGGEVEVVKTSALTGAGLDELLETLFTIAELNDLRANPDRMAIGTCLESSIHGDRGVMAKVIVQRGTLKVGDAIVCGSASGVVKAMFDTLKPRQRVEAAGPSTPVNITGLDQAPGAGEHFFVVPDIAFAREVAVLRLAREREEQLGGAGPQHVTLENLLERLDKDKVTMLNVIIRADTRGSIEALLKEMTKLEHDEVKIKILQAAVGGVTEGDIHLADASDAIVVAFNVVPDDRARSLAEQKGVQVRRYEIIYKVTEDVRASLEGLLKPEQREAELGRALVQRTFVVSRSGTIAGCRVLNGVIPRNARIRVIRESRVIGEYGIESLRREKDDTREVREGYECGIKLAGFNNVKEGDILEAYKIEEVARTLDS